nr:MAG TPA: hypothetical protein [Caudoviricetes sp.]
MQNFVKLIIYNQMKNLGNSFNNIFKKKLINRPRWQSLVLN